MGLVKTIGRWLVGGSQGPTGVINAVGNILDDVFTSEEELLTAAQVMARIKQQPDKAQTEINKMEAQHRSLFVAGWRPFIGWVCGWSLFYHYIVRDWLCWIIALMEKEIAPPPDLAMEHLMTILFGMLGLGVQRSYDKYKKTSK